MNRMALKMLSDGESRIVLFFAFFTVAIVYLFLVFFSLLVIPFAHHNDANLWSYDQEHSLFYEHDHLVRLGRFMGAHLLSFHLSLLNDDLFDLAISRAVAIVFAAALLAWFSIMLHKLRLKKALAFFLSAAIFTLPGMQLYILWVTNFVPGIVTILLAMISVTFGQQIEIRQLLQRKGKSKRDVVYFALALLSLLAALYTYPPTAMFYLVPTLAVVVFSDFARWNETRLRVLRDMLIFSAGVSLYFVTHRFLAPVIDPSITTSQIEASHQFRMTEDLGAKSIWFLKHYSNVSFNLWNIYSKTCISIGVLAFIISGLIIAFYLYYRRSKSKTKRLIQIAQVVAAIIILLILANTPILAAKGSFLAFRMTFTYSAMIAILVGRAILGIGCILPESLRDNTVAVVLFGVMTIAGFHAQYNSTTTALNDNVELNFIRSQIAQKADPQDRGISVFVEMLEGDQSFLGLKIFPAEFNSCATQGIFVPGIVSLALSQLDLKPIQVVGVNSDNTRKDFYKDARSIVINMNDFLRVPSERLEEVRYVDCRADSANGPGFGSTWAFDGSSNTFWETAEHRTGKAFAHWLEVDFGASGRMITKYALKTGNHGDHGRDSTERMPRDWQFEGSNDRSHWTVLDIQENQTNWIVNERRVYSCNDPNEFRYYRLYITAGVNARILRLYELELME